MLSGAQGDDNGSHAGQLGIATGVFGPQGEWADWLVVNFYPHESPNDKGITSATLPMDNSLFDVNSGQLYFRPAYLLVAVLRVPRVAFEVMGHDLLYLAQAGGAEPDLTDFERRLAEDVEAVFFVRLPQVPSSRPGGTYPVRWLLQYGGRALADPVEYPASPESRERRLPAHLASRCPR